MSKLWKIIIVLLLASAVVAVVSLKKAETKEQQAPVIMESAAQSIAIEVNQPEKISEAANQPLTMNIEVVDSKNLPLMIELGSDQCKPCKMMAPILEELSTEYKDKLKIDFIDVWKNPQQGRKYNIRVIPVQIFFDANGKELFRHEGFFPKENILAKWKELGFDFEK
ncbi:MAG: thioredoxin family protein [Phycisphaerae bacterium]|nr:thioredoxin family protein [Phycisphaerae bacterium]